MNGFQWVKQKGAKRHVFNNRIRGATGNRNQSLHRVLDDLEHVGLQQIIANPVVRMPLALGNQALGHVPRL